MVFIPGFQKHLKREFPVKFFSADTDSEKFHFTFFRFDDDYVT